MSSPAVTVSAPSNIALIKYWGSRDLSRALPENVTLSMTLDRCRTVTSAAFEDGATGPDRIEIVDPSGGASEPSAPFRARAVAHLERLRRLAGRRGAFRVATRNTFPMGAGIASSASGFAALTLAAARALGLDPGPEAASVMARDSGSGSAARSVLGGYVVWPSDPEDPESPAAQIAPASHWSLRDVIAVVDAGEKGVSSVEGHRRATSSPHFEARRREVPRRLDTIRRAILARDLAALGPAVEEEAIELHLIAMSSRPPIFYWRPETIAVLEAVREARRDGVAAWFTMDAGPNVHVLCEPESEGAVRTRLEGLTGVRSILSDGVGDGPRPGTEPLFQ